MSLQKGHQIANILLSCIERGHQSDFAFGFIPIVKIVLLSDDWNDFPGENRKNSFASTFCVTLMALISEIELYSICAISLACLALDFQISSFRYGMNCAETNLIFEYN